MSGRKIFMQNDMISLAEHLPEDDLDCYNDWLDKETQKGYNHEFDQTFEEYCNQEFVPLFDAAIILNKNNKLIGSIGISTENPLELPDMSIRIFKPYKNQGFGTTAFKLGAKYCFDILGFEKIYAGCYPDNIKSMRMLEKCGFVPHPGGNIQGEHYLTGEPVTQLDFVLDKKDFKISEE